MAKESIRCFEGNARPHEAFWRIRDVAAGSEPELELYGTISEFMWFEDDITPKIFRDDLARVGNGGPVTIRINSYGGDVIAASMISAIIRDYPGVVTVQVDGMAASAATVVAIAGNRLRMQESAYFMIHDPSVVFMNAQLNIEDLTRLANNLQAVKEGIINAYENKTGLSRTRLAKMMTEETLMDAHQAVTLGFADEVIQGGKQVTRLDRAAVINAVRNFMNVPVELRDRLRPESTHAEPPDVSRLRAECQFYTKESVR